MSKIIDNQLAAEGYMSDWDCIRHLEEMIAKDQIAIAKLEVGIAKLKLKIMHKEIHISDLKRSYTDEEME
jgi:hypothetical protein